MVSVQDRLKMKRILLDEWNALEKLVLVRAVREWGEGNWAAVSRPVKTQMLNLGKSRPRPSDWYSMKNCELQYKLLMQSADTPKRKKRGSTGAETESARDSLERKLTEVQISEIKARMEEKRQAYQELLDDTCDLCLADPGDCIDDIVDKFRQRDVKKKKDAEAYERYIREREERKREMARPNILMQSILQRESSMSEPSSEPDSPLNEPLAVDVPEQIPLKVDKPQPAATPTSPLLTMLLNSAVSRAASPPAATSPSAATAAAATASILHSAITSPRAGTPTIASLLNSSSSVPPSNTSPLKNLATAGSFEDASKLLMSPSQGAPTLSMLLELPPSVPGKPLPVLPPAPPPYAEHLGPPPPYSLAKEYLQKQRAEALQAQQAILNVEKELMQATMGTVDGPIGALTSPIKQSLKTDVLVDLDDIEEVIAGDTTRSQFSIAGLSNPSDHDYNLIKPRMEDILPDATIAVIMPKHIPEMQSAAPLTPAAPTAVTPTPASPPLQLGDPELSKTPKKQLDVFEFGEEEEENDTNMTYKRSVAKRLAEKEAKMASPVKNRSEDDVLVDVEEEIDEAVTDVSVHEEIVEMESNPESEMTVMFEINPAESVAEEPEVVAPVEEEEDAVITEEGEIDPDLADFDTKDDVESECKSCDEKTEDEPAEEMKARRMTLTLSNSDSLPSSPGPVTEEEKDWKAWKRSVLLVHGRIEGHKSASLFLKPITNPEYTACVRRPIDLSTLKRSIEAGLIRTANEYRREIQNMFMNAIVYNRISSVVHLEAKKMLEDSLEHIKFLEDLMEDAPPAKRELRAHEKAEKLPTKRQSRQSVRGSVEAKRVRTSSKC